MVNRFALADAWMAGMRERHASELVRFRRGDAYVDGPAGLGRSLLERDDNEGVSAAEENQDFFFTAAALILGGEVVTPASTDQIDRTVGEKTLTYELLPVDGEKCFRFCDASRITIRVYTKFVGTT